MANAINWFEIPVTDFQRAKKFYAAIVGSDLYEMQMGDQLMGFFPMGGENKGVGGAIVQGPGNEPGDKGTMIYLNVGEDLSAALGRVEPAGGKIVLPKTLITEEIGYFAIFMDTEGNRVAFHSPK